MDGEFIVQISNVLDIFGVDLERFAGPFKNVTFQSGFGMALKIHNIYQPD